MKTRKQLKFEWAILMKIIDFNRSIMNYLKEKRKSKSECSVMMKRHYKID